MYRESTSLDIVYIYIVDPNLFPKDSDISCWAMFGFDSGPSDIFSSSLSYYSSQRYSRAFGLNPNRQGEQKSAAAQLSAFLSGHRSCVLLVLLVLLVVVTITLPNPSPFPLASGGSSRRQSSSSSPCSSSHSEYSSRPQFCEVSQSFHIDCSNWETLAEKAKPTTTSSSYFTSNSHK
ncbi:MAG: hypothetical protein MHMPM18_002554 [Marteilia pararefringens]